jgi:murein L,D-transpeptidase YcbB/YkuD
MSFSQKSSGESGMNPSERIDQLIEEITYWRGKTFASIRKSMRAIRFCRKRARTGASVRFGATPRKGCNVNSGPTLQSGSTGSDVKRLQRIFVVRKELDYTGIDGAFGAQTQSAVEQFQSDAGLTADGIVGPLTWAALPPDIDAPELAEGATGAEVSRLQHGLTVVGTYSAAIDGDFGPLTAAAVREYQTQRGITVDGIVGDQTWFVPAGAAGATLESLS